MDIGNWLGLWRRAVVDEFGAGRVRFMGIQGSRARGEAGSGSDIDVVLLLDEFSYGDAMRYRACVESLPERDKLCGFVAGEQELKSWPRSELYQFCLDTTPLAGSLDEYAALVTERDILEGALTSVGGIYHACLHNALHERDDGMIAGLFKSAFFAIRAIDRLETGRTLRTRRELTEARPDDAWLINGSADGTFDEISERLLKWSSETLVKLGERV